jgi:hypothetical protein
VSRKGVCGRKSGRQLGFETVELASRRLGVKKLKGFKRLKRLACSF